MGQRMDKTLFDHLLITRFSYRGADCCSVEIDPLDERRLNKRFEIFEAVCLPSVLSQRERNFNWILIIDARLPSMFRDRLDLLISEHAFIHLYIYEPGTRIETVSWLTGYLSPLADYILTTALDDDDALCASYVKTLHEHIRTLESADALPDLKVFGCTKAIQWDYYPARQAPLGYLKPWLRNRGTAGAFPLQSGFTAFIRKGRLDFSSYYFWHSLGDLFLIDDTEFDRLAVSTRSKIQESRDTLRTSVIESGLDWNRVCAEGAFVEVLPEQPCVLMVNTMTNLQRGRLFEYQDRRQPVINESSFPGFGIDLESARQSIPLHGCTLTNFLASILPAYKVAFQTNAACSPVTFFDKFKRAVRTTFRCIRGMLDLCK